MLTNWKTTIPGLVTLGIVLWNAWQTKTLNVDDVIAALVGLGLVQAKDWNVTGGDKRQ
jgi:hypothetical protein